MNRKKYTGPRVVDLETFIHKANHFHDNFYDYSKSEYVKASENIKIVCPHHGEFSQIAYQHARGQKCPSCAIEIRSQKRSHDINWFLNKAEETHGDKYDYSRVKSLKNTQEKVEILCPRHGAFFMSPSNHLYHGKGCSGCAQGKPINPEKFLQRANDAHGDKYDYLMDTFISSQHKLKIICKEHGLFEQMAASHASGQGCPECALINRGWGTSGYYGTNLPSKLYVIIADDLFVKVGLSNNVELRVHKISHESRLDFKIIKCVEGPANALFNLEQRILRHSGLRRFYPKVKFGGSTECLEVSELPDVLSILENWEE